MYTSNSIIHSHPTPWTHHPFTSIQEEKKYFIAPNYSPSLIAWLPFKIKPIETQKHNELGVSYTFHIHYNI